MAQVQQTVNAMLTPQFGLRQYMGLALIGVMAIFFYTPPGHRFDVWMQSSTRKAADIIGMPKPIMSILFVLAWLGGDI